MDNLLELHFSEPIASPSPETKEEEKTNTMENEYARIVAHTALINYCVYTGKYVRYKSHYGGSGHSGYYALLTEATIKTTKEKHIAKEACSRFCSPYEYKYVDNLWTPNNH